VPFTNSDATVIAAFLRSPRVIGISKERLRYRPRIPADGGRPMPGARFWAAVAGVDVDGFSRTDA
jgi:hypothetical protein